MDEDLPHVAEALRGTVCVGVAFETAWKKYRDTGTPMPCTPAEKSGAPCYVYHYGSGFFFHETGLLLTCEHVRRDCRAHINSHAGVLVVCPYKGHGTTLDWSEAWKAEVVAHTAHWDGTTLEPEDPSVRTLPGHDDAAVLRITSSLSTGANIVRPIAVGGSPLKILRLSETGLNTLQQLASLGFPPAGGSDTATPILVRFSEKFDDTFLKLTGSEMMPGHSGGALVTKSGVVVGWNVRNRGDVRLYSHCKLIAVARECIELTLPAGVTWSSLLASPSVGLFGKGRAVLTSLLDKAELSWPTRWPKLHPKFEGTEQLTLEDVELREGDRIVAEVAIMFGVKTVQWPARLQGWDAQSGMAEVRWDAMPEVAWGAEDGKARFVLTPQGPRLYDEDQKLYYKWRRVAPVSSCTRSAGPADGSAGSAEVDEVQGAGGSLASRLWALASRLYWRGVLLLLAYVVYLACRHGIPALMCCMVSLLNESVNHPRIALLIVFGAPILLSAFYRYYYEPYNGETHDETSNETSDETTEAATPKRPTRSPRRPKRS